MPDQPAPEDLARHLINTTRYLVLGTVDPDGRPRVSPVYYAPDGYFDLYWISDAAAHHSRNIAERPDISAVIFDSTAPIGAGQAVYLIARAEQIPDDELDRHIDIACRPRFPEQQPFPADKLRPPAPFRLYHASIGEHSIHVPGRDPTYGTGVDRRLTVSLA